MLRDEKNIPKPTRRAFLLGGAVALVSAAGFIFEQELAERGGETGTKLGIYSDETSGHTLDKLENELGRKFAYQRVNASFDGSGIPTDRDDNWADAGYRIYHNANAETSGAATAQPLWGGWAAVASGSADAYFHDMTARVKADNRFSPTKTFDLSLHHEQCVNSPSQCGVGCAGTTEDYKAFFRYVAGICHADGATIDEGGPMRLVWTPAVSQFKETVEATATKCDPNLKADGTTIDGHYYHLVGLDLYSRITKNGLSIADPTVYLGIVSAYAKERGLKWMIGEYGCQDGTSAESHAEKANFFTKTLAGLKSLGTGIGGCEYLCYSHIAPGKNWVDSSGVSLAAFKTLAKDPWFA